MGRVILIASGVLSLRLPPWWGAVGRGQAVKGERGSFSEKCDRKPKD